MRVMGTYVQKNLHQFIVSRDSLNQKSFNELISRIIHPHVIYAPYGRSDYVLTTNMCVCIRHQLDRNASPLWFM